MIRDPNKKGIGARWESEVFAALPDGELLWSDGIRDYQGHENIIARLDDGRMLVYGWSYGSCPHCDRWEGDEHRISANVAAEMSAMDPEHFADFLVSCRATEATWLPTEGTLKELGLI